MDADRIRVEKSGDDVSRPELADAVALTDCQRKSSRGAGAEPLQGCYLPEPPQQEPERTLSSFLRDNSDLTNGANPLGRQSDTGTFGVNESAAQQAAEPEYLSQCSPKDKPWDSHRADADQIAAIYATHPDFQKLAGRISLCSPSLGFAWAPDRKDPNALTLKLRYARFCRVRHCPICQWRRSLLWRARFYAALPRVVAQHPTARFIFLTLTLKNVPVRELRQTLRAMSKAWERLAQRRSFDVVLGWIRTAEVTRGKDGAAHPHFHVLLMVPPSYFGKHYVTQEKWAEMWRMASRIDYVPVVDVRALKHAAGDRAAILRAVRETLKYAVKPCDMKADVGWFFELTRQLRNLRFIASGGALKGVLRPEEESEKDLLLLRDLNHPQRRLLCFLTGNRYGGATSDLDLGGTVRAACYDPGRGKSR